MKRIDWKNWAPPDRDARQEARNFLLGLGAAAALTWVLFLASYMDARSDLFYTSNGVTILDFSAVMPDLRAVIGARMAGLWVVILAAAVMAAMHYAGHYREGSRPVYLMRRLPDRWEYHRRCLAIPAAAMAATVIVMLVSLVLFYEIYMHFTPAACIAPDQWAKIWRVL